MQTPKISLQQACNVELCLKALTLCPENDQKHHNSCIMNSNILSPPPSPSFSFQIADYIGAESCLDLKDYEDLHTRNSDYTTNVKSYRGKKDQRWAMKKKEFPPPISLLQRSSEKNQASHMPFVLKRYYTSDGRLILTEERARHQEYFRAHRSNGHLTLQLVHLDDDDLVPPFPNEKNKQCHYCNAKAEEDKDEDEDEDEEEIETEDVAANTTGNDNYVEEEIERYDMEETIADQYESKNPESSIENGRVGIDGNGGVGKCLNNYNNTLRMSSSCYLGLPLPAIKPVHT